jgi:hypothetical protein
MSESKWSIFEDKRYDSEMQVCCQCKMYVSKSKGEDEFGICTFLDKLYSPHQLEWAIALGNVKCEGFEFRKRKYNR